MPVLGWVDWALLVVMGVSVVVGLWRGLVFELMSLLGWVVAYVAAQALAPTVAVWLPVGAPDAVWRPLAAFALSFITVLLLWSLLARLVQLMLHATPLTAIDRLLGAVFGLLRGGVLLLVLGTLLAYTPAVRSQPWQDSHGVGLLKVALDGLRPLLPAPMLRLLPP
jgi:membrane protein required for colicin V production